jgi:hypothetical protein
VAEAAATGEPATEIGELPEEALFEILELSPFGIGQAGGT